MSARNSYELEIRGDAARRYAIREFGEARGERVRVPTGPYRTREIALTALCRVGEFCGDGSAVADWGSVYLINTRTGRAEFVR